MDDQGGEELMVIVYQPQALTHPTTHNPDHPQAHPTRHNPDKTLGLTHPTTLHNHPAPLLAHPHPNPPITLLLTILGIDVAKIPNEILRLIGQEITWRMAAV
jgi:hypothetical protein